MLLFRSVPSVGVEIRDGPILIANNLFDSFPTDPNRKSYAIGFYPNNTGQNSPANTIAANEFTNVVRTQHCQHIININLSFVFIPGASILGCCEGSWGGRGWVLEYTIAYFAQKVC